MKRKSLLLMMLLALFSSGAWAQEQESIYSNFTATAGTAGASSSEGYASLVDGDRDTKWCILQQATYSNSPAYCTFHSAELITPVGYVLTTGNDTGNKPGRNPKSWKIEASTDNSNWVILEDITCTSSNQLPESNTADKSYYFQNSNTTAYRYFKFTVTDIWADKWDSWEWWVMQLAEFKFITVPNSGGDAITEISTVADWEVFCSAVNNGHSYSGETVTMTANVGTVNTMCGNDSNPFRGTFDGQGHTLSVSINSSSEGAAPFHNIGNGAVIENLKVTGTVSASAHHAGGLVGFVDQGAGGSSVTTPQAIYTTIRNCHVSTNVSGGDKYIGGIIGHANVGQNTIEGCVYDGTLTSSGYKGGMIGWSNWSALTLTDSYFNGTNSGSGKFDPVACKPYTYAGQSNETLISPITITNFYYNTDGNFDSDSQQNWGLHGTDYASNWNKHARTVTLAANPTAGGTVSLGNITDTYSVSGITAYSTGIKYNNTFYAGSGDQISVTATANSGYAFVNWTKNNEIVSTDATYSFTVTEDADFVANFADPCIITTFPWSENFENYSANTNYSYNATYKLDDPCWVNEHISGNGSYLFQVCSNSQGNNSTHKLQLPDMSSGTMTKLVLPKMDIPTSGYMFAMDVYRNSNYSSYSGEGIRVYASTNGEIEGATELAFIPRVYSVQSGSIPAETGNGWYTYQLPIGISGTCYIILRGESQYGTATYMDNFGVASAFTISATANPTEGGTVSGAGAYIGGTSCTLTATANSGDYIFVNWTKNNEVVSTDATFSFTVTESATYEAHFSLCSDGITITDIPWTENFEAFYHVTSATGWSDSKAYMMNDGCWDINHGDIVNPALYTNYKPAAFSGNTSVQFTNSKGSATLIFPEFTNALNTLQLEFKANAYQPQNEGTIEVGYWYNDQFTAIHTGIQTQTARGANDNTNASGDYMGPYALTGNIPSGSRMALHYNVNTNSGCINLDDFRVSIIIPTKTIASYGNSERGGYYLIASPLAAAIAPTNVDGMITDELGNSATTTSNGTYDLYSFNQAQELEWQNYRASNFNLVNGTGYLYASKNGTTLTFSGAPYSGDTKTVTLSKTEAATGLDFPTWNLVGNPFAVDDAYITKSFYTLENSDAYTVNTAGTAIHPMQGLFVVAENNNESLTFSKTPNREVASLNMNVSKVATRGVSAGSTNVVDQAIISFTEGQELPKLQFRNGSTKVYLPMDGKEYAIVSAKSMGTMPVNFKAEDNGTYTLDFTTKEVSFNYLHLIDNMNGNDVDLLQTPYYTFDAKSTDFASRFTLVFATGSSTGSDNFAFFNNGNWIINNDGEATLQIVDVMGRILSSETISGSCSKAINVATGVYMLRLINGNDVKVQKIVVR